MILSTTSEGALERILRYGVQSASGLDLLTIILCSSESEISKAESHAMDWIQKHGLQQLSTMSLGDLKNLSGIEGFAAQRILAALELGRRAGYAGSGPITEITSPADVATYYNHLRNEKKEHFCALMLNAKNQILGSRTIHVGTLNASLVGAREVFREAIREGAKSIIVVHNHPSGDSAPSGEDIVITQKLAEVGELIDIHLLDHVILGSRDFVSLKQKKLF